MNNVPPLATRRTISASARTGSGIWWTIVFAITASNRPSGNGKFLASPRANRIRSVNSASATFRAPEVEHRPGQIYT